MNLLEALQVVFIALKLAGEIDWSWWVVLTPFWFYGLGEWCKAANEERRREARVAKRKAVRS